ncbi:MAG: hypothetical protein WCK98_01520 [bacterium]
MSELNPNLNFEKNNNPKLELAVEKIRNSETSALSSMASGRFIALTDQQIKADDTVQNEVVKGAKFWGSKIFSGVKRAADWGSRMIFDRFQNDQQYEKLPNFLKDNFASARQVHDLFEGFYTKDQTKPWGMNKILEEVKASTVTHENGESQIDFESFNPKADTLANSYIINLAQEISADEDNSKAKILGLKQICSSFGGLKDEIRKLAQNPASLNEKDFPNLWKAKEAFKEACTEVAGSVMINMQGGNIVDAISANRKEGFEKTSLSKAEARKTYTLWGKGAGEGWFNLTTSLFQRAAVPFVGGWQQAMQPWMSSLGLTIDAKTSPEQVVKILQEKYPNDPAKVRKAVELMLQRSAETGSEMGVKRAVGKIIGSETLGGVEFSQMSGLQSVAEAIKMTAKLQANPEGERKEPASDADLLAELADIRKEQGLFTKYSDGFGEGTKHLFGQIAGMENGKPSFKFFQSYVTNYASLQLQGMALREVQGVAGNAIGSAARGGVQGIAAIDQSVFGSKVGETLQRWDTNSFTKGSVSEFFRNISGLTSEVTSVKGGNVIASHDLAVVNQAISDGKTVLQAGDFTIALDKGVPPTTENIKIALDSLYGKSEKITGSFEAKNLGNGQIEIDTNKKSLNGSNVQDLGEVLAGKGFSGKSVDINGTKGILSSSGDGKFTIATAKAEDFKVVKSTAQAEQNAKNIANLWIQNNTTAISTNAIDGAAVTPSTPSTDQATPEPTPTIVPPTTPVEAIPVVEAKPEPVAEPVVAAKEPEPVAAKVETTNPVPSTQVQPVVEIQTSKGKVASLVDTVKANREAAQTAIPTPESKAPETKLASSNTDAQGVTTNTSQRLIPEYVSDTTEIPVEKGDKLVLNQAFTDAKAQVKSGLKNIPTIEINRSSTSSSKAGLNEGNLGLQRQGVSNTQGRFGNLGLGVQTASNGRLDANLDSARVKAGALIAPNVSINNREIKIPVGATFDLGLGDGKPSTLRIILPNQQTTSLPIQDLNTNQVASLIAPLNDQILLAKRRGDFTEFNRLNGIRNEFVVARANRDVPVVTQTSQIVGVEANPKFGTPTSIARLPDGTQIRIYSSVNDPYSESITSALQRGDLEGARSLAQARDAVIATAQPATPIRAVTGLTVSPLPTNVQQRIVPTTITTGAPFTQPIPAKVEPLAQANLSSVQAIDTKLAEVDAAIEKEKGRLWGTPENDLRQLQQQRSLLVQTRDNYDPKFVTIDGVKIKANGTLTAEQSQAYDSLKKIDALKRTPEQSQLLGILETQKALGPDLDTPNLRNPQQIAVAEQLIRAQYNQAIQSGKSLDEINAIGKRLSALERLATPGVLPNANERKILNELSNDLKGNSAIANAANARLVVAQPLQPLPQISQERVNALTGQVRSALSIDPNTGNVVLNSIPTSQIVSQNLAVLNNTLSTQEARAQAQINIVALNQAQLEFANQQATPIVIPEIRVVNNRLIGLDGKPFTFPASSQAPGTFLNVNGSTIGVVNEDGTVTVIPESQRRVVVNANQPTIGRALNPNIPVIPTPIVIPANLTTGANLGPNGEVLGTDGKPLIISSSGILAGQPYSITVVDRNGVLTQQTVMANPDGSLRNVPQVFVPVESSITAAPETYKRQTFVNKANPVLISGLKNLTGQEFVNQKQALEQTYQAARSIEVNSFNTMKQIALLAQAGKPIPPELASYQESGMSAADYYKLFTDSPETAQKVAVARTNSYIRVYDMTQSSKSTLLALPIGGINISGSNLSTSNILMLGGSDLDSDNTIAIAIPKSQTIVDAPNAKPSLNYDRETGKLVAQYPVFRVNENQYGSLAVSGVQIQDQTLAARIRSGEATNKEVLNYIYQQDPKNPLVEGTLEINPSQSIRNTTLTTDGQSVSLTGSIARQGQNFYNITQNDGTKIGRADLAKFAGIDKKSAGLGIELALNPDNPNITSEQRLELIQKIRESRTLWSRGRLEEQSQEDRYWYAVANVLQETNPELYTKIQNGGIITPAESREALGKYNFSSTSLVTEVLSKTVEDTYEDRIQQYDRLLQGSGLPRSVKGLSEIEALTRLNQLNNYLQKEASLTPAEQDRLNRENARFDPSNLNSIERVRSELNTQYSSFRSKYGQYLADVDLPQNINDLNPDQAAKAWNKLYSELRARKDAGKIPVDITEVIQTNLPLATNSTEISALSKILGLKSESLKVDRSQSFGIGLRGLEFGDQSVLKYSNGDYTDEQARAIKALLDANPAMKREVTQWSNIMGIPIDGMSLGPLGTNVTGLILQQFIPAGFVASGSTETNTSVANLTPDQIQSASRIYTGVGTMLTNKSLVEQYRQVYLSDPTADKAKAFIDLMNSNKGSVGDRYYIGFPDGTRSYFASKEERDIALNVTLSSVMQIQANGIQNDSGIAGVTVTSNYVVPDRGSVQIGAGIPGIQNLRPDVASKVQESMNKLIQTTQNSLEASRNIQNFKVTGETKVFKGSELARMLGGPVIGNGIYGNGGQSDAVRPDANNPMTQVFVANPDEDFVVNLSDLRALQSRLVSYIPLQMVKCQNDGNIIAIQSLLLDSGQETNYNPGGRTQRTTTPGFSQDITSKFDFMAWAKFPEHKQQETTKQKRPEATGNAKQQPSAPAQPKTVDVSNPARPIRATGGGEVAPPPPSQPNLDIASPRVNTGSIEGTGGFEVAPTTSSTGFNMGSTTASSSSNAATGMTNSATTTSSQGVVVR